MRVLIAGGGTGGHIYPGIAIAERLKSHNISVDFACTQRLIDDAILSANPDMFENIIVQPIIPISLNPIRFVHFVRSFIHSKKLIKDYLRKNNDISAVIGLGGFGSVSAILQAYKSRIKTAILNPDLTPGKANLFCQKYANKIFVQWRDTRKYFRKSVDAIGVPLRKKIYDINNKQKKAKYHTEAIKKFGLSEEKKTLIIVGGSSGAKSLNLISERAISQIFSENDMLSGKWQIIHITGANDFDNIKRKYEMLNDTNVKVMKFCERMELLWSVADLAICRAGAITIAELSIVKVPAIFLPYPFHRDNHQKKNAQMIAKTGAGLIIEDDGHAGEQTGKQLKTELLNLLTNENRLADMKSKFEKQNVTSDSAERIAEWAIS